jgi:hypothetical protein
MKAASVGSSDPLTARILLPGEVPPAQEQAIVEAFRTIGVTALARVVPPRRGVGDLPWLVLAALPLQAFLGGLGSEAAKGTYEGLKRLVAVVVGGRPEPARPDQVLVLEDPTSQLRIVLEADLPTDAYRQLVELDLSAYLQGPLHYDRQRSKWRSEPDEWRQRQHQAETPRERA